MPTDSRIGDSGNSTRIPITSSSGLPTARVIAKAKNGTPRMVAIISAECARSIGSRNTRCRSAAVLARIEYATPALASAMVLTRKRRALSYMFPGLPAVTLEFRVQDHQLPQSVHKFRILRLRNGIFDGCVEPSKHLLERVVVAFAVAAGKIGVRSCAFFQQPRILDDHLVVGVAIADPQLVGLLLVPRDAGLASVDFDAEPVLAARGNLA